MDVFTVTLAVGLLVVAFFTATSVLSRPPHPVSLRLARLRETGGGRGAFHIEFSALPMWQRVLLGLSHMVPFAYRRPPRQVMSNLHLIGMRNPNAPDLFFGLKLLLLLIGGTVGMIIGFSNWNSVAHVVIDTVGTTTGTADALDTADQMAAIIMLWALGALIGFVLPNMLLPRRVRRRQEDLRRHLPDTLDLLMVCVDAGMGLDAALQRTVEEQQTVAPVLCGEFLRMNQEVRAGRPREEALRDLVRRTGVDDIQSFSAMIIQSERLGTSIADSLRAFNQSLRTRRKQQVEERAQKTTIKLTLPLVLLILPMVFVVLLGPGMLQIIDLFGQ